MKGLFTTLLLLTVATPAFSQTNPVITKWLRNTTGLKGRHYVAGNSTPLNDTYPANVQSVKYSANWVYVSCSGIPSYVIGPYLDGNPSQGTNQNNIYRIPLNPVHNTGTPSPTTPGTIGVFINGVSLFDFRDAVSYNYNLGINQGGPLGGMGDGVWNRDAVVAERTGFDCAKGHPAMGNYHHHQNPSAFRLDLDVISNVCDLYLSDALYVIDSTVHSPLLGFAYDGFPIYGAYGYKNADGTGGITRMKSSYSLRNITVRTHYANGTDVIDGPPVNSTYPLGLYREDYQYNPTSPATPDYLDDHNGRFCVTPEYPNGIYCYFATVDADWNSAYPYAVGPTFYGIKNVTKVTSITETTTTYNGPPLVVTATPTQINCYGASTGAIQLSISGGNPPFTYNWGGGVTAPNRTNLPAGTYTVTVTDVTSQTKTQTIALTQPAAPLSVQGNATAAPCFGGLGGSIALVAAGGTPVYAYSWSNGATAGLAENLGAGVYTVTVTDAVLCTTVASFTVSQPAAALAATAAVTPVACYGNASGAVSVSVSGGTPGYSYAWNDAGTGATRTGLNAGTFVVTVTDAHACTQSVSAVISQPDTALNMTATITDVACHGSATGALSTNIQGGTAPYLFLWENGQTTPERHTLGAGAYTVTITDAHACTITTVATVSEPQELTGALIQFASLCASAPNGALHTTASGGTPPYAYGWSNGSTASSITGLSGGTYIVTVTDAHQCSLTLADTLWENPLIVTLNSVTNATCGAENGVITLDVTGGIPPYSYLWSNGAQEATITALAGGAYTVTITDGVGCTLQQMVIVNNQNGPVATAQVTPAACYSAASGAVALEVSGGAAPFMFYWTDGDTTQHRTNLTAGTYTVTVEDANHCLTIVSAAVQEPAPLSVATVTQPEACEQHNGIIGITPFGGTAPYAFLWENGATSGAIANLPAGQYTLTLTDAHACTLVQEATVNTLPPPVLAAETASATCFGSTDGAVTVTASGGTAPYTYGWNTAANTPAIQNLGQGSYTVTVTDQAGCTATLTSLVQEPEPLQVDGTVTDITCYYFPNGNGSIHTSVTGGTPPYSYLWGAGQTTPNLDSLSIGSYVLSTTDAHGCLYIAVFQVSGPILPLTPFMLLKDVGCYGDSTGSVGLQCVGGFPPYQYVWEDGSVNPMRNNLPAGVYTVTATDQGACSVVTSFIVSQPAAALEATLSATASNGTDNGAVQAVMTGGTPPYAYWWNTGATTSQLHDLAPGVYTLTAHDANNCVTEASATVTLVTAVEAPGSNISLNVFPNPAAELIMLQSKIILENTLHLTLADATGKVVREKDFYQGTTLAHFETDTLYDGVYFLTVTDGRSRRTYKIIVNH